MIIPSEDLKPLPKYVDKKTDLKDLGITINDNYTTYRLVAGQLIDLQIWITEQLMLNKKETNNGN